MQFGLLIGLTRLRVALMIAGLAFAERCSEAATNRAQG